MPAPTPFHSRTSRLCTSYRWKEWAGYFAVCSYEPHHDSEYFALRHSAGLIDVTPLFKYEVKGPDAAEYLSRVTVKDLRKLRPGRVTYLCWCDDDGKVVDDGTVCRLNQEHFRVTAAEPSLSWFSRLARGYRVSIEDSSDRIAALALQGPTSRDILARMADRKVNDLPFFAATECRLGEVPVRLSRTGYTGDLGYEIWVDNERAERLYDLLMEAGGDFGLLPAGLDALDVTRIEAGFIMNGVDYFSAHHCLVDERKNSPYELGLGWTVQLEREPFVGRDALRRERSSGPQRRLVGLVADWEELEALYDRHGLPPELSAAAWRDGRPVYDDNHAWIGQATSGVWSPTLKQYLALAQVEPARAEPGSTVRLEVTVEYRRYTVAASVAEIPFFDPPRKRA